MSGIAAAAPDIIGSVPQWGMLAALLALLFKNVIPWRQQNLSANELFCKNLTSQVDKLTTNLKHCEETAKASIKELQEELHGMRRQHIQEQISLINTIMRSVDAPELKSMIGLLERVQQNLALSHHKEQERDPKGS